MQSDPHNVHQFHGVSAGLDLLGLLLASRPRDLADDLSRLDVNESGKDITILEVRYECHI